MRAIPKTTTGRTMNLKLSHEFSPLPLVTRS